jgi:polygalacturonase
MLHRISKDGRHIVLAVGTLTSLLAPVAPVGCGQGDSQASGPFDMTSGSGSGFGSASSEGGAGGPDGGGGTAPGKGSGGDAGRGGVGSGDATASSSSSGAVGSSGMGSSGGTGGSSGGRSSSGSSGGSSSGGSSGAGGNGACGAGDSNLPPEPAIPPACATLQATQNVSAGGVPSESALDTSAIQTALNSCASGNAVRLTTSGSNNAFITGPLTVPSGVTLWVDTGVTLYGTRDRTVYGSAGALISVSGSNSGIVGEGIIDGQGGEPNIGSTLSFWDQNGSGGGSPALIAVRGATNFTLYRITLHDSPMFHVKLDAAGFVVWGVTIQTPSKATNSVGTALTYSSAHNTDGIDPGEAASNGYIVCSRISDGDDQIAIKGSSATGVTHLTIAHNHFGAGHGMSIGSEFTGGVSDVSVYDLSIDGMNTGTSGGSSNGIRIKSDSSRGGLVNNVTYSDVCVRNLSNPILLTPYYSSATGSSIPQYTNIAIQNFHDVAGGSNTPKVTLNGYDPSHQNSVTLDNVIIDGISPSNVAASYTDVTLGPGNVNFMPAGANVNVTNNISGASQPNPCSNKWVTF